MFRPVTISSACYQDQVAIHFRPYRGWIKQVARMAPARSFVGVKNGQLEVEATIVIEKTIFETNPTIIIPTTTDD